MKKFLKKILFFFIAVVVILSLWIYIASRDRSDFDDRGLLQTITTIPDSKNGYQAIAFIDNDNKKDSFQLSLDYDTKRNFEAFLNYKKWDSDLAQEIITENKALIDSVISATQFESLQFKLKDELVPFPDYPRIIELSQLVILKSMLEAKSGEIDHAIKLAETAVIFSQQSKMEKNYLLISHMLGLRMQNDILIWLHHLAEDYALNGNQYQALLALFNKIPAYNDDAFEHVFAGELNYIQNMLIKKSELSITKRWQQYVSWWHFSGDMFMFSPTKNKTLHQLAIVYDELRQQSKNYCSNISIKKEDDNSNTLFDLFLLNQKQIISQVKNSYNDYYSRRCFGHTHSNSIKTIIALKAYEHDTGDLPDTLQMLIPEYLKMLPIDAFNGQTLGYSKDKQWLYSVGTNFEDNGGSTEGEYLFHCENEQDCSTNPTFPLKIAHQAATQ